MTFVLLLSSYIIYDNSENNDYSNSETRTIFHVVTDCSFFLAHVFFHKFLWKKHHAYHHKIQHKDENNVIWAFSYASLLENLTIASSLILIPHIIMLLSGFVISEKLLISQLTFVLLTHAHSFKHNHRKHHMYHDLVYGDIFTMLIIRCYNTTINIITRIYTLF